MFGLDFLFGYALLALPLAGLPILLHLLFRRKSPVVEFSTLRFIRSSIQRTAARKRIQRWLLLACRILLLALLIWAVSQPARRLAANWLGSNQSTLVAIVVDTSYSMELEDQQVKLLARGNSMVESLLRNTQFQNAKAALFRSSDDHGDQPVQFVSIAKLQSEWSGLTPQASTRPLVDRIGTAIELLKNQSADQKWLIVISDFQRREFPHALPEFSDGRVILLDLHPEEARSAGISNIALEPAQPIPGISSNVAVEITGRSGDSRAVNLTLTNLDGSPLQQCAAMMANLDVGGKAVVRFEVKLPAQRWLLASASLQATDAMAWDNSRSHLIEIPPRQKVTVLHEATPSPAERFIRLALDPSEGKLISWPLEVRSDRRLTGQENVAVACWSKWPDRIEVSRLIDLVQRGGSLILLLQPGLEEQWAKLPEAESNLLLELLPAAPSRNTRLAGAYRAAVGVINDPLLEGLVDEKFQINSIVARQFVPLEPVERKISTILTLSPATPLPGTRSHGLLYRKMLGQGTVYTFTTIPDSRNTNFATHPIFLPLLVRMSLRPSSESSGQNVELGQPLILSANSANASQLNIENPRHEISMIPATQTPAGNAFVYTKTLLPGLYYWRRPNESAIAAISNVELPAGESEADYRPADEVATEGPNVVIAHSMAELQNKLTTVSRPQPTWSWAVALVLFLLCLEALMGSMSKLWNPLSLQAWLPKNLITRVSGS